MLEVAMHHLNLSLQLSDLERFAKKLDGISATIKVLTERLNEEDIDIDVGEALEYLSDSLYKSSVDLYDTIWELRSTIKELQDGDDGAGAGDDTFDAWYSSIGDDLDGISLAFQDTTAEGAISELGQATIDASTPADDKH